MKKIVSLFVVVILAATFVACSNASELKGSTTKTITKSQVQSAINAAEEDAITSSWNGRLNIIKLNGENVIEFSYEITGMAVSEMDSSTFDTALRLLANADLSLLDSRTYAQAVDLARTVNKITGLFASGESSTISEVKSDAVSLICNGTTKKCNGWSVFAEVNNSTNTVIIHAKNQ